MLTFPKVMEAVLSLTLVLFLVSRESVQNYLSIVPAVHLRIFLVFFFLLSSAHFIEKEKTTFPFLTWGMYSGPYDKPQIDFYDYEGVEANGRRVRIIPEAVFPVMMHSRLIKKFDYLLMISKSPELNNVPPVEIETQGIKKITHFISSLFNRQSLSPAQATKMIDALLLAMGREYNHHHPNNSIVSIEIILKKRELNLDPDAEITKELIQRVNLIQGIEDR